MGDKMVMVKLLVSNPRWGAQVLPHNAGEVASFPREMADSLVGANLAVLLDAATIAELANARPAPVQPRPLPPKLDLTVDGDGILRQLPQPDDDPAVREIRSQLAALQESANGLQLEGTKARELAHDGSKEMALAIGKRRDEKVIERLRAEADRLSATSERVKFREEAVHQAIDDAQRELDVAWKRALESCSEAWAGVLTRLTEAIEPVKRPYMQAKAREAIVRRAFEALLGRVERDLLVRVRFSRSAEAGPHRIIYNRGEIAGFRPEEARELVGVGAAEFVESWRTPGAAS